MYLTLAKLSLKISRFVEDYKLNRDLRQQIRRERKFCKLVSGLNKLMEEASVDEDAFSSIFYDGYNLSLQVHDTATGRNTYVFSYPFAHAFAMKPPGALMSASEVDDDDDDDTNEVS